MDGWESASSYTSNYIVGAVSRDALSVITSGMMAVCSIRLDQSSFRIRMYVYITSDVATHAIYSSLGSRRISKPKAPTASLTSVGGFETVR